MLQKIAIERFKSLSDIQLELGDFNLFIGTNASGKSNFFDALRVIQGINYGFTVSEVLDGKPKSSTGEIWPGIRGGSLGVLSKFLQPSDSNSNQTIKIATTRSIDGSVYEHEIVFRPLSMGITLEQFSVNSKPLFKVYDPVPLVSRAVDLYIHSDQSPITNKASDRSRSWIGNLEHLAATSEVGPSQFATKYLTDASDMQFLDLHIEVLRQYSQNRNVRRMGDRGEDFAALVKNLISIPRMKEDYLSWLRELVPSEINDIAILEGALGEPLFAIKDGANEFAAPLLSDGTLRFAALTAALFQPDAPRTLLIEEIENGIHPTRLRLLVELLRSRAAKGKSQLFITTHSPTVLAWLKPEEYDHTFLCIRSEDGSSVITPVSSLPHFIDAVQRTPFADLFAEGWLETTL